MTYILVEATNPKELMIRVNDFIEEGFKLQGGISVACHYSGSIYYTQAMVK
jgi:Domain of unknown function (DUF1737)